MKAFLKTLLGLGISALCLWLVARNVDLSRVWAVMRTADPAWLAAGIGVYLASFGVRAKRWALLLEPSQVLTAHAVRRSAGSACSAPTRSPARPPASHRLPGIGGPPCAYP